MSKVKEITQIVGRKFRTFGGGRVTPNNPISHALKDQPFQFAAGVDVESVVIAILEEAKATLAKVQRVEQEKR